MSIIVSAYFDIPSKQPKAFYMQHIERLLGAVVQPIIFFTTKDLHQDLLRFRKGLPIYFSFLDSVYDFQAIKKFGYSFWEYMYSIDPESYHSPQLGAVWYEKKEFVKRAIQIAEEHNINTNVPFIWCDAGCVRNNSWLQYISTFGMNTKVIHRDKLMFQQIRPSPLVSSEIQYFRFPFTWIAGAIIAGYKESWYKCSDMYDDVLIKYYKQQNSAISDQYVWSSVVLLHPDSFLLVDASVCPSVENWFFFLQYLSMNRHIEHII
jgi:hypothetical protein